MLLLLLSFSDTFILIKQKAKRRKISFPTKHWFLMFHKRLNTPFNKFVCNAPISFYLFPRKQFDELEDTRDYLWLYVWVCSQLQSHKFGRQHNNRSSVNFLESLKTLFWLIADRDIITIKWPKMAKPNLIVSIKIIFIRALYVFIHWSNTTPYT